MDTSRKSASTAAIHGHGFYDSRYGVFIPPIYLTVVYEQPNRALGCTLMTDRGTDLKYSREENVTARALENVLAKLELAEDALVFNSGMAALAAIYLYSLRRGVKVVLPMEAYGTTIQLITILSERLGAEVYKAWPSTEAVVDAIDENTELVLIETMTNPTLKVFDVREIAKRAREVGALLVVDNTFVTPVIYNPTRDRADAVVHSLTKYIAGHNDVVGGAVASSKELIRELWEWRRMLGSILQPFEAYLILRGVKTLEARVEKQCKSALAIAEFLRDHPKVKEVSYPGLPDSPYKPIADRLFNRRLYGAMVSFKVVGGREGALKVLNKVRIIKPSPSLGGTESLLTYPVISAAKTLPSDERIKLGITDDLLRLSVGLEDVNDLIEDLDQALNSV
ncbi:MAG: cystathionine gamma-synthase family protein [Thermoprotei archaeon]|nr:MAG: cystathionine gamma-synthase family protein [Thermoprotei archaeon]